MLCNLFSIKKNKNQKIFFKCINYFPFFTFLFSSNLFHIRFKETALL